VHNVLIYNNPERYSQANCSVKRTVSGSSISKLSQHNSSAISSSYAITIYPLYLVCSLIYYHRGVYSVHNKLQYKFHTINSKKLKGKKRQNSI